MRYIELCKVYEAIEHTTKRLEKTEIVTNFLSKCNEDIIEEVVLLLQGLVYPPWDERKLGFASRMVIKALKHSTGYDENQIEELWVKTGDLGLTAEELTKNKKQITLVRSPLTIREVFSTLRKLASLEGSGSVERKISLVSKLLTSSEPLESRYIIRTVLGELRVGIGEGLLRDALVWTFFNDNHWRYDKDKNDIVFIKIDRQSYNKLIETIQQAIDITNDVAYIAKELARLSKQYNHNTEEILKRIQEIRLEPMRPIKVMLAQKVDSISELFDRVGKPAQIEFKFDGFRMQIHKKGKDIIIFTRRLENVTKQFPEVVEYVRAHVEGNEFIIEGEAIGYDPKTKHYMPFQNISQRIKRKYNIDKMVKDLPVELQLFDIVYYNGQSLLNKELKDRRALLEKIVKQERFKVMIAEAIITDKEDIAKEFYSQALTKGHEGVMGKNIKGKYRPGLRVGEWVKLKPVMETLDLVIVGAEWGEGKRAKWLTSYYLACKDDSGQLYTIGKASTGIKEKSPGLSYEEMTRLLKPLIITKKGKYVGVKPQIVVEVIYQEIQKSPTYGSGYALRFPRIKNLRPDRGIEDITTLKYVESLYESQKKKEV